MFESFAQFLPQILGAGIQGIGAAKNFKASQKGVDYSGQNQINRKMMQLADAQANPDSPAFQKLYTQNRQMGATNLAQTIAELQRQNRKAISMGRSPLLDQERGGESIFRNLILGQQDNEMNARNATFGQLRAALQGYNAPFENTGALSRGDYVNEMAGAAGYDSLGAALKNLFSLQNKKKQGMSVLSEGDLINWNTPRINAI